MGAEGCLVCRAFGALSTLSFSLEPNYFSESFIANTAFDLQHGLSVHIISEGMESQAVKGSGFLNCCFPPPLLVGGKGD